jgi:hypothetical protein
VAVRHLNDYLQSNFKTGLYDLCARSLGRELNLRARLWRDVYVG